MNRTILTFQIPNQRLPRYVINAQGNILVGTESYLIGQSKNEVLQQLWEHVGYMQAKAVELFQELEVAESGVYVLISHRCQEQDSLEAAIIPQRTSNALCLLTSVCVVPKTNFVPHFIVSGTVTDEMTIKEVVATGLHGILAVPTAQVQL